MRLKNKSALVTAAGQGIGRASVLAMAAEGAQVLATDVNASLLKDLDGIANVFTALLDVTDKAAIFNIISSMPRIDILFNCAGIVNNGSILDATDEESAASFVSLSQLVRLFLEDSALVCCQLVLSNVVPLTDSERTCLIPASSTDG